MKRLFQWFKNYFYNRRMKKRAEELRKYDPFIYK
jgi:hypothetical protein